MRNRKQQTIEYLLHNRGCSEDFIANVENNIEPTMFNYRPTCCEQAVDILKTSKNVLVYYDPDVDGVMSGEICSLAMTLLGKRVFKHVNAHRHHGFTQKAFDLLIKNKIDTCICVDFSADAEWIKKLTDSNISVICVDHHEPHEMVRHSDKHCLINNQYPHETDNNDIVSLSGAGVVYYFVLEVLRLQGLETEYNWVKNGNDLKVLVGVSLLADSRDIENEICRYFLYVTYNKYEGTRYSDYILSARIGDYVFGEPKIDRNFIDFEFSPVINSLFRFNKGTDVIKSIADLKLHDELKVYKTYQKALVEALLKNIEVQTWSNLVVGEILCKNKDKLVKNVADFNLENFVGLVASRIKEEYIKTSLVLTDTDKGYKRGSVRGHNSRFNYLSIFKQYTQANGHKMAFGTYISTDIDFGKLNEDLRKEEPELIEYANIDVNNLKAYLLQNNAKQIANINMYLKSERQILFNYLGNGIRLQKCTNNYSEFTVDGIGVRSFKEYKNKIHPVITGGYLQLFLE